MHKIKAILLLITLILAVTIANAQTYTRQRHISRSFAAVQDITLVTWVKCLQA